MQCFPARLSLFFSQMNAISPSFPWQHYVSETKTRKGGAGFSVSLHWESGLREGGWSQELSHHTLGCCSLLRALQSEFSHPHSYHSKMRSQQVGHSQHEYPFLRNCKGTSQFTWHTGSVPILSKRSLGLQFTWIEQHPPCILNVYLCPLLCFISPFPLLWIDWYTAFSLPPYFL